MSAVLRFGVLLSAGIVLAGLAWAAYVGLESGAGAAFTALFGAAFGAVMALALIWLGVFVVFVVLTVVRVSREL
jgi:hypothetical protein